MRTLRNDVATLRELGYPVGASPGVAGGYRLGSGSRLPPLLLDDDEAMAVTLGLILAASHGLSDTADSSMRAFSKVVALLPSRLRPRLESLAGATLNAPLGSPSVATDLLPPIAERGDVVAQGAHRHPELGRQGCAGVVARHLQPGEETKQPGGGRQHRITLPNDAEPDLPQ